MWNILLKGWKETISWEKIFVNHIPNKRHVSKIYEELSNLKSKKTILLQNGWMNKHFTEEMTGTWKDD